MFEKANARPLGKAFNGERPPAHFASNTSIILSRARAWSKFGGKMINSSAGSPAGSCCKVEVFRAGGAAADRADGEREREVEPPARWLCNQCKPTETPWA